MMRLPPILPAAALAAMAIAPAAVAGGAKSAKAPPATAAPLRAPAAPVPDALPPPPPPVAPPAPVGFVTAADLRDWCLSPSPTLASSCFAYITGVHDTVRAYEAWLNLKEYCAPADATRSDLRDAFNSYIVHASEHAFGEAASVVVVALKQAYPCPPAAPPRR